MIQTTHTHTTTTTAALTPAQTHYIRHSGIVAYISSSSPLTASLSIPYRNALRIIKVTEVKPTHM